jgi:DNA-binding NarL/FixJ family response regulator
MPQPTVLIVDDHPGFRGLARAVLEAEGFTVLGEAVDAADAIGATRALAPDAVLLDVQLPDGDGFAVAGALVKQTRPPAVVLTSSRDVEEYGTLVPASGARGFIPKHALTGAALAAFLA